MPLYIKKKNSIHTNNKVCYWSGSEFCLRVLFSPFFFSPGDLRQPPRGFRGAGVVPQLLPFPVSLVAPGRLPLLPLPAVQGDPVRVHLHDGGRGHRAVPRRVLPARLPVHEEQGQQVTWQIRREGRRYLLPKGQKDKLWTKIQYIC